MKVAFCGSHGTGKTTAMLLMASALKKKGYNVALVTETARKCPFPINEKATVEAQQWIFSKAILTELEAKKEVSKKEKNIILCDRTLLDILSYMNRISPTEAKSLDPFVRRYMSTYDIIFHMKPKKGYLKKDGIRSVNKQFQKHIDKIIKEYEIDMGIPVLNAKTNKERIKFIEEFEKGRF